MESIKVNPKRMSVQIQRLMMMMIAIFVAVLTVTTCFEGENDNTDEGGDNVQTVTYTGSASGAEYTLEIIGSADQLPYNPKGGDKYTLTASSKTSSGNVVSFNGTDFTLKPSNSSASFNATVSGSELTGISGTITWKDNSSSQGPGAFTPSSSNDPNTQESNWVKTGTLIYKGVADLIYKEVCDDVNKRYSWTVFHPNGDWLTTAENCGGNWYFWTNIDLGGPYYHECNNYDCGGRTQLLRCFHRGIFDGSWKRLADQTILGMTCSVWTDNNYELAVYRGVIFKQIINGELERLAESFTETISDRDFAPPTDYSIDPNWDKKEFCE